VSSLGVPARITAAGSRLPTQAARPRCAETPLNVLELLWINLIMDALAALGPLLRQYIFAPPSLSLLISLCRPLGQGLPHQDFLGLAAPGRSGCLARPRSAACGASPVADAGRPLCAALATELPSEDLLLEKPHGRTESVISPRMWKHILVQGCYQIGVLMLVIYAAPRLIDKYSVRCSPGRGRCFPPRLAACAACVRPRREPAHALLCRCNEKRQVAYSAVLFPVGSMPSSAAALLLCCTPV